MFDQILKQSLPYLAWFAVIAFIFLVFLWTRYNQFITKRNSVNTNFSDIEIQLKRRASLIEKLAGLVKDYAKHEKGTFEDVAKARSMLDTSQTVKDKAEAENMFSKTLRSLFMVSENYPKLQANQNFLSLRDDLKETENLIAKYREEYNVTVEDYNNAIQKFPNLLAAKVFKFQDAEFFRQE